MHATVLPIEGRGLVGPGELKLTFSDGGAVEFHSMYQHLMTIAGALGASTETEPLPLYTESPHESHQTLMVAPSDAAASSSSAQVQSGTSAQGQNASSVDPAIPPPPHSE